MGFGGLRLRISPESACFYICACCKLYLTFCDSAVNGRGYIIFDVMGEVLHWGGQLLVSYVLVGLAYGWTLSSTAVQKIVPDDKVRCRGIADENWLLKRFWWWVCEEEIPTVDGGNPHTLRVECVLQRVATIVLDFIDPLACPTIVDGGKRWRCTQMLTYVHHMDVVVQLIITMAQTAPCLTRCSWHLKYHADRSRHGICNRV